jgi:hypothetical protein
MIPEDSTTAAHQYWLRTIEEDRAESAPQPPPACEDERHRGAQLRYQHSTLVAARVCLSTRSLNVGVGACRKGRNLGRRRSREDGAMINREARLSRRPKPAANIILAPPPAFGPGGVGRDRPATAHPAVLRLQFDMDARAAIASVGVFQGLESRSFCGMVNFADQRALLHHAHRGTILKATEAYERRCRKL